LLPKTKLHLQPENQKQLILKTISINIHSIVKEQTVVKKQLDLNSKGITNSEKDLKSCFLIKSKGKEGRRIQTN